MAFKKVHQDEWIKAVRPDPKETSDQMVVLEGYIGQSSVDGHIRVYTDETLGNFIEIPESDIVYHIEIKDSTLGGSRLWVNADTIYTYGDPKEKRRPKATFLSGDLNPEAHSPYMHITGSGKGPCWTDKCPDAKIHPSQACQPYSKYADKDCTRSHGQCTAPILCHHTYACNDIRPNAMPNASVATVCLSQPNHCFSLGWCNPSSPVVCRTHWVSCPGGVCLLPTRYPICHSTVCPTPFTFTITPTTPQIGQYQQWSNSFRGDTGYEGFNPYQGM